MAAELIADLERIHQRSKQADKQLKELVTATGTTLMDLHGIGGPSGAARLLVEIGDINRFPNRAHLASRGTAPHPSTPPAAIRSATGNPEQATGRSTGY